MPEQRTHKRHDSLLARIAAVAVVAATGLAVVLLAGVPAVVHVGVFALVAVAAGIVAVERWRARRPLGVPFVAAPLVAGAALTLLSIVPLPRALRVVLAPESVDRLERLVPLLSADAAALVRPVLSFDPPESALALLRLLTGVFIVVVITHGSRTREGRRVVFRALLATAFVTAFAVLFAEAVGIPRAFGVVGVPFNPNHRARVCGALALLCLTRAATLRARVEAAWFATAGTALALLVFATLSKGGIAALIIGVAVLGVIVAVKAPTAVRVAVPVVGVAGVVVGLFWIGQHNLENLSNELAHPERLKTFLWEPGLRLATVEPFVGVGNNAFGAVFPSVLARDELDATLTYSHAENIVVQTLADHGAVAGLFVVFAALAVVVVVLRTLSRPAEFVAVPALVFLVVGDLFDFATETPAGLGLAAICLGLLGGRLAERRVVAVAVPARLVAVTVVAVVVVGFVFAPGAVRNWRRSTDEAIAAVAVGDRTALLERALAAHPSDAPYATQLAIEGRRDSDPSMALRFSNRAINLWPALQAAHLEAARAFFAIGRPKQGLLEYREVWRSGGNVLNEVARRTLDPELRRIALPDPLQAKHLAALCDVLVREKRIIEARVCYRDVTVLPDASPLHRRHAIDLALDENDLDDARALVAALPQPIDGEDAAFAARVEERAHGADAALATSAPWIGAMKDPVPLLEWRLETQRLAHHFDDAEATILKLRPLMHTMAQSTRLDLVLVDVRRVRGDHVGALEALHRALMARPHDLMLLLTKVRLEVSNGDRAAAESTLGAMRRALPGNKASASDDKRIDAAVKAIATLPP